VADYYSCYKVVGNKARWESISKVEWFKTRSLFIIILYFFISKSLSTNASTILLLLTRLTILIKTYRSGSCSKER